MLKAELNRRALLTAMATLPLAACAHRVGANPPGDLGVATFNIWHDAGGHWPARRALLAAALREADADVIALQEVLEDSKKGLPNQADTIARDLSYAAVHFVAPEPEGSPKRYGNAILTRLPVIEVARRKLAPLSDYRTAIRVRVRTASGPVDIVATHLAWQPEAAAVRAEQLADLLAWLPTDGTPLVVMGDFNAPLDDPGLAAMGPPRFVSALPQGAAETTLNPARGHKPRVIDHIFADAAAFAVSGARVIGNTPVDGEYPSDHFGVAARLTRR
ncbi:Endonuclease/exonuclease/phosphatase precursor [Sphingopyxis sp. LC81]|uniref:endonuclease/exonuclease/phosphatase family protein n=1 Tax=Sphingopyxis sp. LC81 TaxID=1502850 RepID=UPI00050FFE96|nr:endonuclease/exonuclease/phosphatase family protein [Sphingopyxis sp. LC81]KGB55413.1 Endonuclease/exonuclease/phosphatase precursor [Sphingopyxis sp. LC81]